MFATIWMCTHEWSLISMRATAFTFETCHQPFSCLSSLTRSISVRSLRLPRTGTLIRIRSIASAGVRRVSRCASSGTGCSIRSSVSLSIAIPGSLRAPCAIRCEIGTKLAQRCAVFLDIVGLEGGGLSSPPGLGVCIEIGDGPRPKRARPRERPPLWTCVVGGEETRSGRLPRDRREGGVAVRAAAQAAAGAAVGVGHEDVAGLLDRRIHEVEQVAALVRATAHPDAAALHRVARRRVDGRPRGAAVVRGCDVQVPCTRETEAWSSPPVVEPRNANAARLSSPATIAGNWTLLIPSAAP